MKSKSKEIIRLLKENGITIKDLKNTMNDYSEAMKQIEHDEIKTQVESNKCFLGRYYCGKDVSGRVDIVGEKGPTYYKVVSVHSEEPDTVYCLYFGEKPTIYQSINIHRAWVPGDRVLGRFRFDGFKAESIGINELTEMKEITKSEFEAAARKHLELLLAAEWDK